MQAQGKYKVNCQVKWKNREKKRKKWKIKNKRSWSKKYMKEKHERNRSIKLWKSTSS